MSRDLCYIYLGSDVKNDAFTLYHALGHVYIFKRLGLFVNMSLNYEASEECRREDIDTVAMILGPVRNNIDDILADLTVYSALRKIDQHRAEDYWKSATHDAVLAAEIITRLATELSSASDLMLYASMLAESVYKRRTGLTKRTTEKLGKYVERNGFQEAVELMDAIVYEMNALTSYSVKKRFEKKRRITEYIIEVEVFVVCIDLRNLG